MDGENATGVHAFARRHAPAVLDAPPAEAGARGLQALGGRADAVNFRISNFELRMKNCAPSGECASKFFIRNSKFLIRWRQAAARLTANAIIRITNTAAVIAT